MSKLGWEVVEERERRRPSVQMAVVVPLAHIPFAPGMFVLAMHFPCDSASLFGSHAPPRECASLAFRPPIPVAWHVLESPHCAEGMRPELAQLTASHLQGHQLLSRVPRHHHHHQ